MTYIPISTATRSGGDTNPKAASRKAVPAASVTIIATVEPMTPRTPKRKPPAKMSSGAMSRAVQSWSGEKSTTIAITVAVSSRWATATTRRRLRGGRSGAVRMTSATL